MYIKRLRSSLSLYLASFFISIFLTAIVFTVLGITPFGPRMLSISDLGAQYIPFLAYLKEQVTAPGGSFLYSFSNGLGDNFIPLAAYYLMSPFNLLTLFFSRSLLPIAISLLIILKIGTISLSMAFYLHKTFGKKDAMLCFLAVSYSLSAFVTSYFYNIMWLDALIWLPVCTYFLQQLIDENKIYGYLVCLFFAIWTNYYLGYMICLFLVLYFFYWTLRQNTYTSFKDYYQRNRKPFLRFAGVSVLAAGLTGILLVPTVFGMLHTGKAAFNPKIFSITPMFGFEVFSQVGLGGINYTTRLHHLPACFAGSLVLILAVFYFVARKVSWRDKILRGGMLIVLFLNMWVYLLYSVWHMFQATAGFPFRNAFVFLFFLIIVAYEGWMHNNKQAHFHYFRISLIILVMLVIGYITNNYIAARGGTYPKLEIESFLWSAGFLLLIGFCLYRMRLSSLRGARSAYFFVFLVAIFCELGMNFYQMTKQAPYNDLADYQQYVEDYEVAFAKIQTDEQTFHRVENNVPLSRWNLKASSYNDAFLFNYLSITNYSSTLNADVRNLFGDLGLFTKNERRISNIGKTELDDFLFNTRYRIEPAEELSIEENPLAIGVGFTISPELEKLDLKERQPFTNQNAIYKALSGEDKPLFHPVSLTQVVDKPTKAGNYYKLKLINQQAGTLYCWLPKSYQHYKELLVNGQAVETKIDVTRKTLLQLGTFEKDEEIEIVITADEPVKLLSEHFQTVDTSALVEMAHKLEPNVFQLASWKDGQMNGTVNASEDGYLYLSIPYDRFWKIKVDGEKVEAKPLLNSMLGIPLGAGEHTIHLSYRPEGFMLGAILSAGSLLILIGSLIWRYTLSKKLPKQSDQNRQ